MERLEARDHETALHICATHHSHIIGSCLQQTGCQQQGRHTRDTGIAHDDGLCGETQDPGHLTGAGTRRQVVCRLLGQLVYVPFRRTENKHDALPGRIDCSILQRPSDRRGCQRLERSQALCSQRLPLRLTEQRGGEWLGQLPVVCITAKSGTTSLHGLIVLLRRLTQGRQDIICNLIYHNYLHSKVKAPSLLPFQVEGRILPYQLILQVHEHLHGVTCGIEALIFRVTNLVVEDYLR